MSRAANSGKVSVPARRPQSGPLAKASGCLSPCCQSSGSESLLSWACRDKRTSMPWSKVSWRRLTLVSQFLFLNRHQKPSEMYPVVVFHEGGHPTCPAASCEMDVVRLHVTGGPNSDVR